MNETRVDNTFIEIAADIISAYVSNNSIPAAELPALIGMVHGSLSQIASGSEKLGDAEKQNPAVPIKKSITPDYLICLEDGRKLRSLKRHLRSIYNMTPEDYRAKWNLPRDYPMVAPTYSEARSRLAKKMGLGQKGK